MLLSKKMFIGGVSAIIIGAFGAVPTFYYMQRDQVSADTPSIQSSGPVTAAPQTITGKPIRIVVSGVGIDLNVADGAYNAKTGEWTLSKNKAYYALMTVQPNDAQGNTLIYGHALSNVFGKLQGVKVGTEALIYTDNGYVFRYQFISTQAVKPTETSILDYEGTPNLTLQTCSGSWYQNRQLYDFDFIEVTKTI